MKIARPGDPIPAAEWNQLRADVRLLLQIVLGRGKQHERRLPATYAHVVNDTGADRDRGDVVAYAAKFKPSASDRNAWTQPILNATTPAWPADSHRIAILSEPIKAGKTGRAIVHGFAVAKIDDASSGNFAHLVDGEHTLKLCNSGPVKAEKGSDSLALIDLDGHQYLHRYTLTADFSTAEAAATIRDVEGNTIADDVVHDPDEFSMFRDQVTGDVGWCQLAGGKLWAIQGPCTTGA